MVFVYIALAMAMQLLFWFVPNIIVNAVAVCVLGMYALSQLAPPRYTRKQNRFTYTRMKLTTDVTAGFFIGPLYPVGLCVLIQVVPRDIHIGALGKYTCLPTLPPHYY